MTDTTPAEGTEHLGCTECGGTGTVYLPDVDGWHPEPCDAYATAEGTEGHEHDWVDATATGARVAAYCDVWGCTATKPRPTPPVPAAEDAARAVVDALGTLMADCYDGPDLNDLADAALDAAMAGSGEQPGDDAISQARDPNPDHPLWGYRRANRPAPVVPDSAKSAPSSAKAWSNDSATMRERMHENWRVFKKHVPAGAYLPVGQMDGDCRECGGSWPCAAVLAVVGQGNPPTWDERDEGLSDAHSESYRAGWRMGRNVGWRAAMEVVGQGVSAGHTPACPHGCVPDHAPRAVVRSGEQGGEGRG